MAVTIYTKPGCPYCAAAMAHMRATGERFDERVVTNDPAAMAEFRRLSPDGLVPAIVAEDGSVTLGWQGGG